MHTSPESTPFLQLTAGLVKRFDACCAAAATPTSRPLRFVPLSSTGLDRCVTSPAPTYPLFRDFNALIRSPRSQPLFADCFFFCERRGSRDNPALHPSSLSGPAPSSRGPQYCLISILPLHPGAEGGRAFAPGSRSLYVLFTWANSPTLLHECTAPVFLTPVV